MPVSLLVPPGADPAHRVALRDEAISDLELHQIVRGMSRRGISEAGVLGVLTELPQNPDEITYRQETMRCFWTNAALCEEMDDLVRMMQEVTVFARSGQETDRPLLEAIYRLGELELYVDLVTRMRAVLERVPERSRGLNDLLRELRLRETDAAFTELAVELPKLRSGFKIHQSVTIGVNLDDKLRPVEAALLGINDRRFHEGHFLGGFLSKAGGDPYLTRTPLTRSADAADVFGITAERLPLAPLFEELDTVLRPMLRPLARALRTYVSVNTDIFRRIFPEIAFFLGARSWLRDIADAGYPFCFPGILPSDRRLSAFRGLYNLRLAAHWGADGAERMVTNDVGLDGAARLFVLTGPNGGGKTTFTQALGIATVLGQAGLPIPATSAELAPVDAIFTHFPAEEEFDDELGRFEDEARRISDLFDRVSPESMVLLNEPLASTGPREAERIACSVLSGLAMAGVRGVFTTHFHELARMAPEINRDRPGAASAIGTLNAGVRYEHGRAVRTYEVTSGPPSGSSFAEDVARRYRIDAESLEQRFRGESGAAEGPDARRDLA